MSSEKIIALYERLSREDENLGESYSIQNQKKLLEDFCREKGWTRFRHFTDMKTPSLIQFNDLRRLAGRGGKLRGQGG